jgi:hypothetical protein
MSDNQEDELVYCPAFISKQQDGKKIKQVVFDEREGDK